MSLGVKLLFLVLGVLPLFISYLFFSTLNVYFGFETLFCDQTEKVTLSSITSILVKFTSHNSIMSKS